jgi:hypothetical protein
MLDIIHHVQPPMFFVQFNIQSNLHKKKKPHIHHAAAQEGK